METRTTWSKVTFLREFSLPGFDGVLPPGDYDLVTEEERLQGLSFDAYRRSSAYLEVVPDPRFPGRTELHPVTERDLQQARGHATDPADGAALHASAAGLMTRETR